LNKYSIREGFFKVVEYLAFELKFVRNIQKTHVSQKKIIVAYSTVIRTYIAFMVEGTRNIEGNGQTLRLKRLYGQLSET
jgi:hypothetical protein